MTKEIGDSTLIDTWAATGTIIEPDLSKKNQGWTLGERPLHEFMNWIQNILGKKINHMLSRGVADWDTTTSYAIGATVNHTGSLWVALVANDASEPTGANTNWSEVQDAVAVSDAIDTAIVSNIGSTAEIGALIFATTVPGTNDPTSLVNYGDVIAGTGVYPCAACLTNFGSDTNVAAQGAAIGFGTWKCLGRISSSGNAIGTLFQRVT